MARENKSIEMLLGDEAERLLRERRTALGLIPPSTKTLGLLREAVALLLSGTTPEQAEGLDATPDETVLAASRFAIDALVAQCCDRKTLRLDMAEKMMGRP